MQRANYWTLFVAEQDPETFRQLRQPIPTVWDYLELRVIDVVSTVKKLGEAGNAWWYGLRGGAEFQRGFIWAKGQSQGEQSHTYAAESDGCWWPIIWIEFGDYIVLVPMYCPALGARRSRPWLGNRSRMWTMPQHWIFDIVALPLPHMHFDLPLDWDNVVVAHLRESESGSSQPVASGSTSYDESPGAPQQVGPMASQPSVDSSSITSTSQPGASQPWSIISLPTTSQSGASQSWATISQPATSPGASQEWAMISQSATTQSGATGQSWVMPPQHVDEDIANLSDVMSVVSDVDSVSTIS